MLNELEVRLRDKEGGDGKISINCVYLDSRLALAMVFG